MVLLDKISVINKYLHRTGETWEDIEVDVEFGDGFRKDS
jgi:hypothetical protein